MIYTGGFHRHATHVHVWSTIMAFTDYWCSNVTWDIIPSSFKCHSCCRKGSCLTLPLNCVIGDLHPKQIFNMFQAQFLNYQHFFWKVTNAFWIKFCEKLKNTILVSQMLCKFDHSNIVHVLISNSEPFDHFQVLRQFTSNIIIFYHSVDSFEIVHKTCSILVQVQVPL